MRRIVFAIIVTIVTILLIIALWFVFLIPLPPMHWDLSR
jgi:hypothetical protein